MKKTNEFHPIIIRRNGKFQTYHIYFWDGSDDIPYLVPAKGIVLGKREAFAICNVINTWGATYARREKATTRTDTAGAKERVTNAAAYEAFVSN